MEVSKLESSLYYAQGVGDYSTDYSCDTGVQKVVSCVLILLLEIFESPEEAITPKGHFAYCGDHPFVKSFPAILSVDVLGCTVDVYHKIVI